MRKFAVILLGMLTALEVFAQTPGDSQNVFYQGKWYIGASASSLNLNYHKGEKWNLDVQAKAGYLFIDDWMITANLGYENSTYRSSTLKLGAGLRYYIEDNGIYMGLSGNYCHAYSVDDFKPELNVGYAFFLSRHLTIEPELYYEYSFKCSDYSGFGARLGFGLYF